MTCVANVVLRTPRSRMERPRAYASLMVQDRGEALEGFERPRSRGLISAVAFSQSGEESRGFVFFPVKRRTFNDTKLPAE